MTNTTDQQQSRVSWLKDLPEGAEDWERLSKLMPEQFQALANLQGSIWETSPDPALMELLRLRMAQLLRCDAALEVHNPRAIEAGLSEEKALAVGDWPASPLFTDKERHWLAFTEQWIGDVNGITDELFDPLLEYNTPGECKHMVFSLWPLEQMLRITAVLRLDRSPELRWASGPSKGDEDGKHAG